MTEEPSAVPQPWLRDFLATAQRQRGFQLLSLRENSAEFRVGPPVPHVAFVILALLVGGLAYGISSVLPGQPLAWTGHLERTLPWLAVVAVAWVGAVLSRPLRQERMVFRAGDGRILVHPTSRAGDVLPAALGLAGAAVALLLLAQAVTADWGASCGSSTMRSGDQCVTRSGSGGTTTSGYGEEKAVSGVVQILVIGGLGAAGLGGLAWFWAHGGTDWFGIWRDSRRSRSEP